MWGSVGAGGLLKNQGLTERERGQILSAGLYTGSAGGLLKNQGLTER